MAIAQRNAIACCRGGGPYDGCVFEVAPNRPELILDRGQVRHRYRLAGALGLCGYSGRERFSYQYSGPEAIQ